MAKLLAALNDSAATRPVLEAALGLGRLIGADVEAIHVGDEDGLTATGLAERAEVPMTRSAGPVVPTILLALDAPDVVALAIGGRRLPMGRRPAGHVTLEVLAAATKPVMVVPPQAVRSWTHPLRRVLVPLDDTPESSEALSTFLSDIVAGADVEVTALHVVDAERIPAYLDHPGRDIDAWQRSFQERNCPTAHHLEWREGNAAEEIIDVCSSLEPDLIVASFGGRLHADRGQVVRELLGRAPSPILVLPVRRMREPDACERVSTSSRNESRRTAK